jgi:chromate reductase
MLSILSGSSRPTSSTGKVAKAIYHACVAHGISGDQILMPDFTTYDIPFHNAGEVTKTNLSGFQNSVYQAMSKADMIFILTPEYNWFPSAEIINLINQYGTREFSDCWDKKIFVTCGISSGRGGRIPAVQLSYVLNKLINVMDFHSVVSPKMFESQFTGKALDVDGNSLGNEEYDKGLHKFVNYNWV